MKYSTEIRYEKSFTAEYKNLSKISEFVRKAAERAGFNELEVYELQLAVDEAFSNIIEHAYGGENKSDVDCICYDSPEHMSITLHDWGKSFDPDSIIEPDFSLPLEEIQTRGAGLVLMRNTMDTLEYKFTENDGNYVTMIKEK